MALALSWTQEDFRHTKAHVLPSWFSQHICFTTHHLFKPDVVDGLVQMKQGRNKDWAAG